MRGRERRVGQRRRVGKVEKGESGRNATNAADDESLGLDSRVTVVPIS